MRTGMTLVNRESVGIGQPVHQMGRVDRIGRRHHLEEETRVGKVRPTHQPASAAGGIRKILEGFQNQPHLLGIAARETMGSQLAKKIDSLRAGPSTLIAIEIENQRLQYDRMLWSVAA